MPAPMMIVSYSSEMTKDGAKEQWRKRKVEPSDAVRGRFPTLIPNP